MNINEESVIEIRNERKKAAIEHTKRMNEKYSNGTSLSIETTKVYLPTSFKEIENDERSKEPLVIFNNCDTVTAVFKHRQNHRKLAILNFASFLLPGGGYIEGSMAQEEAICTDSNLYNILSKMSEFYEENKNHTNNSFYDNRGLYTPGVVFERLSQGIRTQADVITCAAPNKNRLMNWEGFKEEDNIKVLSDRIKFIKNIAESNDVDTLILGAYGCGVFGQNPEEVAELFDEIFKTTTIRKIVYAVPGNDKNAEVFKIKFNERKENL